MWTRTIADQSGCQHHSPAKTKIYLSQEKLQRRAQHTKIQVSLREWWNGWNFPWPSEPEDTLTWVYFPSAWFLYNLYICQMGYKYESLPIRKDRYTLLLGSQFLIILKFKKGFLYGTSVSLMYHSIIDSLKCLTHKHLSTGNVSEIGSSQAIISRSYTQPTHRVQSCMYVKM